MPIAETTAAGAQGAGQGFGLLAGAAVGTAAIGGFSLAAFIVMVMTQPRSTREWAVALISTLVGSFGGGASAIVYFELYRHFVPGDPVMMTLAIMELIGVAFTCGLPGWLIVRVAFNTMNGWQSKTAKEVVTDVKDML